MPKDAKRVAAEIQEIGQRSDKRMTFCESKKKRREKGSTGKSATAESIIQPPSLFLETPMEENTESHLLIVQLARSLFKFMPPFLIHFLIRSPGQETKSPND